MKAGDLRRAILQAAVQGKLVSQNIHGEPASELLKRIRLGKIRFIEAGEIKREKALPPILEDEIPYDLPEGWVWCKLNDLVRKIGAGSTPTGGRNVYKTHGYKFLRSQNVYNYGLILDRVAYIDSNIHERMKTAEVYAGDLLLNITGASIGRSCIVPDDFDIGHVNQHVMIIRLVNNIIRDYIHIVLISPYLQETIMEKQVGVSREGLSGTKLKNFYIPFPPKEEQQRIVAKVDELMALCDQLEAEEEKLNALEKHFAEYLPKSILQAAVQGKLVSQNIYDEPASDLLKKIQREKSQLIKEGKHKKEKHLSPITEDEIPYDLPYGWIWCRISDVTLINPRNCLDDDVEVAFLPMVLISSNYLSGHQQEKRIWKNVKNSFTHFAENDVLMAKITPCFQNGKSCIASKLRSGFGAGTTELHVLRTLKIHPQYLLIYIKNPTFLLDCAMNMTGTAGQQRVPTDYLKKYLFPLPPLFEQQRIVAKVDQLMTFCDELKVAYTTPVDLHVAENVIPFPISKSEPEELALAARGDAKQLSKEALQAMEELFSEDGE